jgi:diguanylate cyclase (GGDEF)-like protein
VVVSIVVGCGLALFLLATGVGIGWFVSRWGVKPVAEKDDSEQLAKLVKELSHWTSDVSTDVTEYRALIEAFSHQLADESAGDLNPEACTATAILAQMLEANRRLQMRLDAAESRLQQQKREIAEYMSEARTDPLTGLCNRRVFDEVLSNALAAWHAQGKLLSIALVDIDRFKSLNDSLGHLAGDLVLREVARVMKDVAPRGSFVARYGGEEFACVLPGHDLAAACEIGEKLREAVEQHGFQFEQQSLQLTVSCGVAQATFGEDTAFVKRCDTALYAAMAGGRNAVYLHDGYNCIAFRTGGTPGELSPSHEERLFRDFRDVCQDLRSRLAQVSVTSDR